MNIVLVGFSHCGKTTLGKLLAKQLKRPFYDTDFLIIEGTSFQTAREFYHKIGEVAFRQRETEIMTKLIKQKNAIIAPGGGAVLKEENRMLLKHNSQFIYLNTPIDILWARIKKKGVPAYLDPVDPYKDFLQVYVERDPQYEALADFIVNVQNKTKKTIVKVIKKIIEEIG